MIVNYEGVEPTRGTPGSAGGDLISKHYRTIYPGGTAKISTGTKVAIPRGYVGLVFARSSLFEKRGLKLVNSVGVIDSDYRSEIILHVENDSGRRSNVEAGDRLAQIVVVPCYMDAFVEADLDETGRGGFGSTGQ